MAAGARQGASAHSAGAAIAVRHLTELHHTQLAVVVVGPNAPRVREGHLRGVRRPRATSLGELYEDPSDPAALDVSAELARPALTAVAPQGTEVGERALRLLTGRIAQRGRRELRLR